MGSGDGAGLGTSRFWLLKCLCSVGTCQPGEFSCRNGRCVPEKLKCDGKDDCLDGTDESKCDRSKNRCPAGRRPAGWVLTPGSVSRPSALVLQRCSDFSFRCRDGRCISKQNPECDGRPDCEDGSDEDDCRALASHLVPLPVPVHVSRPCVCCQNAG